MEGFVSQTPWLNCDVTVPVDIEGRVARYALISQGMRFGQTELGEIDPSTREFRVFGSVNDERGIPKAITFFETLDRPRIKLYVPVSQLPYLKTIEEVLSIPSISIRREYAR